MIVKGHHIPDEMLGRAIENAATKPWFSARDAKRELRLLIGPEPEPLICSEAINRQLQKARKAGLIEFRCGLWREKR